MKTIFSILLLFSMTISGFSQIANSNTHCHSLFSLHGGPSKIVGDQFTNYDLGLTFGTTILYRPVRGWGFGISPSFSHWSAKIPQPLSSEISASEMNYGINGVIRRIGPSFSGLHPYLQIESGVNVLNSKTEVQGRRDESAETYFGMVYGGGVLVNNLEFGFTYNVIYDKLSDGNLSWMSVTLGYAVF